MDRNSRAATEDAIVVAGHESTTTAFTTSTEPLRVAPEEHDSGQDGMKHGSRGSSELSVGNSVRSSSLGAGVTDPAPTYIPSHHNGSISNPGLSLGPGVPIDTFNRESSHLDTISKSNGKPSSSLSINTDNLDHSPGYADSTPNSFAQVNARSPSGTNQEVARNGGRRSRGIRHRGASLIGGSMSVFSVRPEVPRTPSQSAKSSNRGKSRKASNGSNKRKRSNGGDGNESDSSENFTPLSQSRSGRKIIQVTPIIKIEDESRPSPKTGEKISPVSKTATKPGERKKSGSKRNPGGASAVCKNCGRLHSPDSNAMVFCDGCNTGWHQHCHDPPIPRDIVLIESKEWFCSDCVVMKEEKVRLQDKVSGQNMTLFEKRRYLQTLSSRELVSLLLHACSVHPDLPIFGTQNGDTSIEDLYDDEDVLPFPKPGNGILLPPEKEHLHFLLDDDTDVYSHCTSGIAQLVAAARANMSRNGLMALKI